MNAPYEDEWSDGYQHGWKDAREASKTARDARVAAVEALDAEVIAESLNSRWGTDHVHLMVARHIVGLIRAALHSDPSESS